MDDVTVLAAQVTDEIKKMGLLAATAQGLEWQ